MTSREVSNDPNKDSTNETSLVALCGGRVSYRRRQLYQRTLDRSDSLVICHFYVCMFSRVRYAYAKIPDRNFAIALRGARRKLMEVDVIPADRRPPEKEETWTLAADQQDSCVCFDGTIDSKVKDAHNSEKTQLKPPTEVISVDAGDNVDNSLPRSQETRKSKTKKVKSYLKKCKGALSKGDENVTEKRRQENCTSWYLDDVPTCANQQEDCDEPPEKYTEFSEERLEEAVHDVESVEDPIPDTLEEHFLRGENLEEIQHVALTSLLEENRRAELSRSRTSLYEDAKDVNSEHPVSDEKTPTKELEFFRDEEKKDSAISLETLTTEDTNLNKCDSSDTLIAEVPEATETTTDLNSELTIIVKEEEDAPKNPADEEILVPACCGILFDKAWNELDVVFHESVYGRTIVGINHDEEK
ncbi:hypothetical protein ALC62_05139 [Cyphomyrmex costatus]|uniref:Uncharacterized protein n=1 Tax=Cyphomyrmex costatus TaxID=456900 RepID=A0A195CUL3_9HYME|nr:hypothetical protein ALC62_05139 [Cyphomyrmex costatus]